MDRYAPSCFCQCRTVQNPGGKQTTTPARAAERADQVAWSAVEAAHELVRPIARVRGERDRTGGRGGWSYVATCSCGETSEHKSHEQNAELWHEDHARNEADMDAERRTLPLEAGGYL